MDTALQLRKAYDKKQSLTDQEIEQYLAASPIVKKLTKDWVEQPFFAIFRLLCLAEIPYSQRLPYTQNLMAYVIATTATEEGFSYTGKVEGIVPCYNVMLLEAFTRLGQAKSPEVQAALNWIKRYQVFERNHTTSWPHKGICKHGGCMLKTPCYIGIGKTVRGLITYAEYTSHRDEEVEVLIKQGTDYMLKHQLFQRLSNQQPISAHITDIMFPQAYMLSLTDLVFIANKAHLWEDKQSQPLKDLLREKEIAPQQWKLDYIYGHKGYKAFETRRKASEWIGYLFAEVCKT
ncbi:hypothetical protein [Enterococcus sp. AZ072]|uniref:hypothetical protein n=1 Tax=unclassified Enterococcus TaxID=2608891 RepID=UPI003D2D7E56